MLFHITRFHALVLLTWQFSIFFASQQIFPIFSNYVPNWRCSEDEPFAKNCTAYELCEETVQFESLYFHSTALEYKWICGSKAYLASLYSQIQFGGVLLGTILFGTLSDYFGRKPISIIALAGGIISSLLSGALATHLATVARLEILRWAEGKLEQMRESERRIAGIAGKKYVEEEIKPLMRTKTFKDVLKDGSLLKRVSVLWAMWFTASICGYATDLNSSNISGNLFINQVLFSVLIAGSKVVLVAFDTLYPKFSRRNLHQYAQAVVIVCFSILSGLGVAILVVNLVGTIFIEYTWDACYLCAVESVPTNTRATSLGTCSLVARIGAILAPTLTFLNSIWAPSAYLTVAALGLINLSISFKWLVETKGVNLDTVKLDEESFGEEELQMMPKTEAQPTNRDARKLED
ncbi:major facilitator superfamily protein [Aphelenchoides avenae]|nr:major facilitator superfamily protein [Aphelenchus avenae]